MASFREGGKPFNISVNISFLNLTVNLSIMAVAFLMNLVVHMAFLSIKDLKDEFQKC